MSPRLALAPLLLALAGCVLPYRAPRPGEPAALVKVRLAFDRPSMLRMLERAGVGGARPRTLRATLLVDHGGRSELLVAREWGQLLDQDVDAPLDTLAAQLHAGRPTAITVRLGVGWSTTTVQTRTVMETQTHTEPRTVTRTRSTYDPGSRSTRSETYTTTELVTVSRQVSKQVTEPVTRTHEAGCSAVVRLTPEKDGVYLIDYTNPLLTEGCAAALFRQRPGPDGQFALERL